MKTSWIHLHGQRFCEKTAKVRHEKESFEKFAENSLIFSKLNTIFLLSGFTTGGGIFPISAEGDLLPVPPGYATGNWMCSL